MEKNRSRTQELDNSLVTCVLYAKLHCLYTLKIASIQLHHRAQMWRLLLHLKNERVYMITVCSSSQFEMIGSSNIRKNQFDFERNNNNHATDELRQQKWHHTQGNKMSSHRAHQFTSFAVQKWQMMISMNMCVLACVYSHFFSFVVYFFWQFINTKWHFCPSHL